MPLFIINDDITKLKVDAIVTAANNTLLSVGGVDGKIFRAAGPGLAEECISLNGCETGDAKITKGYNLPAKYIIHNVGPIWRGGDNGEEKLLISCYNRSLQVAVENKCQSVAFTMISTGTYCFPKFKAMQIAKKTIKQFLDKSEEDLDVFIVLYGDDISGYFKEEDKLNKYFSYGTTTAWRMPDWSEERIYREVANLRTAARFGSSDESNKQHSQLYNNFLSLDDILKNPQESFSSMVMRKIKETGMDEVVCYRAANVNRQIFSKIRNSAWDDAGEVYRPTKSTALAFALALKLSFNEAKELLGKAGYAFSRSDKTDIIVEYCIANRIYDVMEVNDILYSYNLPGLGSTKWYGEK